MPQKPAFFLVSIVTPSIATINCSEKPSLFIKPMSLKNSSVIHTDGWRGYDALVDVGYDKHFRVNHYNNEFSRGDGAHINGIESFWSFAKRRLAKFNGVRVSFELHSKECEWRWGRRHVELEIELFKIMTKIHNLLV